MFQDGRNFPQPFKGIVFASRVTDPRNAQLQVGNKPIQEEWANMTRSARNQ